MFDAPLGHHQGWAQQPEDDHLGSLVPLSMAGGRMMGGYGGGSDAGKSEDGDAGESLSPHFPPGGLARSASSSLLATFPLKTKLRSEHASS